MKKHLLIILISFYSHFIIAQSFEIYNGDTINRIDMNGKKSGKWIVFNKRIHKPGYKDDQIVEQGDFSSNKKVGIWKEYFPNNKLKSVVTYENNRPQGEATLYNEDGSIKETGVWKDNRWIGEYKFYYTAGSIKWKFNFEEKGRRDGKQFYYYPNGQLMWERNFVNGKEDGKSFKYTSKRKLFEECTFENGMETEKNKIENCVEFDEYFKVQKDSIKKGDFELNDTPNRIMPY